MGLASVSEVRANGWLRRSGLRRCRGARPHFARPGPSTRKTGPLDAQDRAPRRARTGPSTRKTWPLAPQELPLGAQELAVGALDRVAPMIVAFSISPMAGDETGSVTEAVAAAVRVVRESGLPNETNAMFTNIEGEWDEVMAVVKAAVLKVAESSPRVGFVLKADLRPGFEGELEAKVQRVEDRLR